MPSTAGDLQVRATTAADLESVVALGARSLGWVGDERDRAFLRWKHEDNAFGASPGWAAFDGDRMVAFRTLMRWRLSSRDEQLEMVRAVDTATDPEYRGQGLFRRLTTEAVDSLTAGGVSAVFNTPNDQSRPGYLKMGWSVVGRPTLMVQPSGPGTLVRMVRARVPAEKWSDPVHVGVPALDALAGRPEPSDPGDGRFRTELTSAFLRWRYGFEPLGYRAVDVRGGCCVFRVRRRGGLREVVIADWRSDRPDPGAVRRLVREVGDYAVAFGLSARHGFVPLPGQGPVVTWRPLARPGVPEMGDLAFSLGDIELF